MHEKITDIQNTIWKMYKDFLKDKNVQGWTKKAQDLQAKYQSDNETIRGYVGNIVYAWIPVINEIKAQEWKKEGENE